MQYIQDWALYRQYTPDTTVASFVTDTGMSEYGTFLFYASQPEVLDAEAFNRQCEKKEQTTAILGCYDGQKIHIYNVKDARLAGIRPTTAAHEMLHAAYRRLSDAERQEVDALIEAEYATLKNDEELADRVAFYERTQPGERDNELHSIIGTEIGTISTELEAHYKRYFSDRSKVVSQHEQYRSVFDELRAKSDTLAKEIDSLAETITSQKATYGAESDELQSTITSFNARAARGDFKDQASFNQERQVLVARSSSLETLRTEINDAITRYNTLVVEFNSVALETNALNRSMDSELSPAPSL